MLEWRACCGRRANVGDAVVTPRSRILVIHLPCGAFVWNRPLGLIVERQGRIERIPIVDVTGIVLLILSALAVGCFSWTFVQSKEGNR